MRKQKLSSLGLATCLLISVAHAQRATGPVTIAVTTTSHGFAIPMDFSGLSIETSTIMNGNNGISGHLFSPTDNPQVLTLFQNIGLKNLRVGGGTVDQSYSPSCADIDTLFNFAPLAGVKVIYSLRLLNSATLPNSCGYLGDTSDKGTAAYIFSKGYQSSLSSFSIGNEPDWHSFHTYCTATGCTCTYPTGCTGDSTNLHTNDPLIYETAAIGDRTTAGTAYQAYKADWNNFETAVAGAASGATFSGPDTGDYDTLTYYNGTSWTQNFANDEKSSGLAAALQHNYTGHGPTVSCDGNDFALTTQNAIDDMLSPDWVTGTTITTLPYSQDNTCGPNGTNGFVYTPYPWLYTNNLAPVVTAGVPYRLTESNDFLTGVDGASNGYAAGLWALDYMSWWAAHNAAGVNFHNKQWIFTDTIVPNPNPCTGTCGNYQTTPKGYGIKAFDLGGHGYVEPVTLTFPNGSFNVTAYAVGDGMDTYITIINKTHLSTNDIKDAVVTIQPNGFTSATASWIAVSNGDPGNASSLTATLGGASILNNARWTGAWTALSPDTSGSVTLTVPSTSAAVVKIHAASIYTGPIQMNQNGALEMFGEDASGNLWHSWQKAANVPNSPLVNWNSWAELAGVTATGSATVVKNQNNTLEVFMPTSGDVYHAWQLTPGGAWSSWTDMGASSVGITSLQAGNNADGSLSVFGIGTNGDVWYASQSAPGVGWSNWTDLSGQQIKSGFVVGQDLNGHLEIFGVDSAGTVWHNWQTNTSWNWNGWASLTGASLNQQLAIARNLDGRLEIFGVDTSGNVWHNWQTTPAGAWNGWSEITGKQLKPGFVVGQNNDGRLVLFGVATTSPNDVWNIWQQGSPGGNFGGSWTDMGGSAMDPHLVVSSTADGRIQLFGVSSSSPYDVWSDWQPATGGWNGWTDFGQSGLKFYAGQP